MVLAPEKRQVQVAEPELAVQVVAVVEREQAAREVQERQRPLAREQLVAWEVLQSLTALEHQHLQPLQLPR